MADAEKYIKKIKVGSTDYNIQAALADVASKTTGILTLTGAATGTFNGSGNTTINIPTISGPTGAIGPIGPTGLQGLKGNTGDTGPTGATGSVASITTLGTGSFITTMVLNTSTKVLTVSKYASLFSLYITLISNSSTTLGGGIVARYITSYGRDTSGSYSLSQLATNLTNHGYTSQQTSCPCTGTVKQGSTTFIAVGIYASSSTTVSIVGVQPGITSGSLTDLPINNTSGMFSITVVAQTIK